MLHTIDLKFQKVDQAIAAYLFESDEGPILFETGAHSTFPRLCSEVEKLGYQIEDIQHVFVTHIHLDHAGAAWALAEHGATIYMHPFGKKHMADPSKLLSSAQRIYGDMMQALWGDLKAIPENQIRILKHEEEVKIGKTIVKSWHTPGHAVHHIAFQLDKLLIAGDVAGVKIANGMVVAPCPPPDINIEDWKASITILRKLDVEKIYLTHFGEVSDVQKHLDSLTFILDDWSAFIRPYFEKNVPPQEVIAPFMQHVRGQLQAHGISKEGLQQYEAANPSAMSVFGLMRYWKKKT